MEERTKLFHWSKKNFYIKLVGEIGRHVAKADRKGAMPAIRLNGTSDIMWERIFPNLFKVFPQVQFFDYTKFPIDLRKHLPSNYYLVRSNSEDNNHLLEDMICNGSNVCVVFDTKRKDALPQFYRGIPVIDGDMTDLRFLDPTGVVVGLRAKGKARRLKASDNGFVIQTPTN